MPIYLVTAYRWGSSNEHQYQVYCGPDRTKADALASDEVTGRGGKYDCAVYEFNEDGTEYKQVSYFPARDDQSEPRRNWRIDMFERLGHFMDDWFDGQVLLPKQDNPGVLHYVKVDVPELVKFEVQRERERFQTLADLDAKRLAERASQT